MRARTAMWGTRAFLDDTGRRTELRGIGSAMPPPLRRNDGTSGSSWIGKGRRTDDYR